MTGNEALALGALHAGVKVVTGYPGTPSTGALESLLALNPPGVHVEWSTNEKVAFEIALGAAWAGHRALCTMKMSGLNVAYDSLISAAYSGIVGGLVIYVADDPGVSAGMAEQDSRGFAHHVRPADDRAGLGGRSVPAGADGVRALGADEHARVHPAGDGDRQLVCAGGGARRLRRPGRDRQPVLIRDINKFTKAGSAICMAQHRDLIARLDKAGQIMDEMGLNPLQLAPEAGGVGIVACGVVASYLDEGLEIAARYGLDPKSVSVLRVVGRPSVPGAAGARALAPLQHDPDPGGAGAVHRAGILRRSATDGLPGQVDRQAERAVRARGRVRRAPRGAGHRRGAGLAIPADAFQGNAEAEKLAAARPITVCAGCPHRGTFMAINNAIRKAGFKKDDVMVTGDIGCTILGMNPPFNTVWNELSMGASIGLAQGYVYSGVKTPVIATIGDSTFFHAGLPALVNVVQHQVPLTLIIMDNGWTSMTGMQVNPGTSEDFQQPGSQRLDIARIVPAMGVDQFLVD